LDHLTEHDELQAVIRDIDAANHAWKLAQEIFGPTAPVAVSLRERKTGLQIGLLRDFHGLVQLFEEPSEDGEGVYGIVVRDPCGGRENAAHIPVEAVRRRLAPSLIVTLTRRAGIS
jgi:hypothetical protein